MNRSSPTRKPFPEEFLMDVGVAVFDPGLDEIESDEEETTNHQIRLAESRYAPFMLAETLIRSGNWGIVYVMPNEASPMDILVEGTVLQSTGESMAMRVEVSDATGRHWYTRGVSRGHQPVQLRTRAADAERPVPGALQLHCKRSA